MFTGRLIRLFIYLVISIGMIVLLWNIPKGNAEKSKNNSEKEIDSITTPGYIIGDFIFLTPEFRKSPPFNINLPSNDSLAQGMVAMEIEIDSSGNYIVNQQKIDKNELMKMISVQKVNEPKLFLKITVHPRSKTEKLMNLVEFAKREKLKIGFTKN